MAKLRRDRPRKKRSAVEVLMALLGVSFILLAVLVVVLLFTHGCSVVHYPLDLEQRM
jgi:hypothetical protein